MSYIIGALYFLYGIVIGSFLNVCIYRLPKGENIVSKRSHCMACGNVLKWYELIPVVSFLAQGGKCRRCHARISAQYPLIEAANGVAWVWIYSVCGLSLESVLFCICASVLLVISVIDVRTMEIPAGCNWVLFLLGILRVMTDLANWPKYLIGFCAVSGFFLLLSLLTGGRAIGGGDIKLTAAAGLLLGWKQIILAAVLACIIGAVCHLTLMAVKKKDRVLAFGPYLSLGIGISMLYGERLISWYLNWLIG